MKYFIVPFVPLVIAGLFLAGSVDARHPESGSSIHPIRETVVEINQHGKATLRGSITAIASSTLSIRSWGGIWKINMDDRTEFIPKEGATSLALGDFIGVQGTVATSTDWTIHARLVRNWSEKKELANNRKEIKQEAKHIRKSRPKPDFAKGNVSSVASSSITLNASSTPLTVIVTTGTKLISRIWSLITMAEIKIGDKLQVWGTQASSTISASLIRDLSIPR